MLKPPAPVGESERLRTLDLYRVLDAESEAAFDDLTRLAAAICDCPISLISLVDRDRQWFLSRVGLDASQTPRDVSFCAHAILGPDVFVVEDASRDSRFADNPLVTSAPAIRFYAGAPLAAPNGAQLGTLCVIDHKPKALTRLQLDSLNVLRQAVVTQMELRRALLDWKAFERTLPICAWCRKIQKEDGSWISLHDYMMATSLITHGMCPECSTGMKQPS